MLNRSTQYLSLFAGIALFAYGVVKLFNDHDWGLLLLSILIIGFTVSSILRRREGK